MNNAHFSERERPTTQIFIIMKGYLKTWDKICIILWGWLWRFLCGGGVGDFIWAETFFKPTTRIGIFSDFCCKYRTINSMQYFHSFKVCLQDISFRNYPKVFKPYPARVRWSSTVKIYYQIIQIMETDLIPPIVIQSAKLHSAFSKWQRKRRHAYFAFVYSV